MLVTQFSSAILPSSPSLHAGCQRCSSNQAHCFIFMLHAPSPTSSQEVLTLGPVTKSLRIGLSSSRLLRNRDIARRSGVSAILELEAPQAGGIGTLRLAVPVWFFEHIGVSVGLWSGQPEAAEGVGPEFQKAKSHQLEVYTNDK
ncbi:uncharacterized protein A4U43_C01F24920 [Asparagus officinalis]|uniref:Uncharacterized protein n=1 Tax=Asparagus officinalis TaxID=4686 RepID=A0A5P1FSJ3_ASPOF|nr:uncharacterized protein A4U43_C01F24920 [Asparagus officinalis]